MHFYQGSASRYLVLLMLAGVVGLLALSLARGAGALALLPLLFLFACPILHMFLHRGHSAGSASARVPDEPIQGPWPWQRRGSGR